MWALEGLVATSREELVHRDVVAPPGPERHQDAKVPNTETRKHDANIDE